MYFPELNRKLLIRTQKTMADPAMAANENNTATSSPGLPRYFLQMSENSKISPCFAGGTENLTSINSMVTNLLQFFPCIIEFFMK